MIMIEVRGTLISGGVYLAGELVRIEVCFRNLSETKDEHIAVACAEIHCQCSFSEQKVKATCTPKSRLSVDGNTSFAPSLGKAVAREKSSIPIAGRIFYAQLFDHCVVQRDRYSDSRAWWTRNIENLPVRHYSVCTCYVVPEMPLGVAYP